MSFASTGLPDTWKEALLQGVGWCWWCGDSIAMGVLLSRPSSLLLQAEARAIGHELDQETSPYKATGTGLKVIKGEKFQNYTNYQYQPFITLRICQHLN